MWAPLVLAQNTRELSLAEVTQLALENHPQLKISQKSIDIAKQQKNITQLQQLPTIEASANAVCVLPANVSNNTKLLFESIPLTSPLNSPSVRNDRKRPPDRDRQNAR